ncbi:hypothetical protein VCV18_012646 [Metarhizium anisopliae]
MAVAELVLRPSHVQTPELGGWIGNPQARRNAESLLPASWAELAYVVKYLASGYAQVVLNNSDDKSVNPRYELRFIKPRSYHEAAIHWSNRAVA